MRLYLHHPNKKPLEGFLNLTPYPQNLRQKPCVLDNLDEFIDNAECFEIIADQVIDFVHIHQIMKTLEHWTSKLHINGKIKIVGNDFYEVCREVLNQNINTVQANQILFGNHQHAWDIKNGGITLHECVEILQSLGLKIIKKKLNGIQYLVEAQRNK